MRTLHFTLIWFVSRGLSLAVQMWDRRRLPIEAREAAWNYASWGSAVFNFAELSMLGWGWVSRPHWAWWKRVLLSLGGFVAVELVLDLFEWFLVAVAGLPELYGPK